MLSKFSDRSDMKFKLLIIFVVCLINETSSFDKFQQFDNQKFFQNSVKTASSKSTDDKTCDRQLNAFSDALSKRELWALQSMKVLFCFKP